MKKEKTTEKPPDYRENIEAKNTNRYKDLWSRPGYLIRRLHKIHVGLFAEACGPENVTAVQFAIL